MKQAQHGRKNGVNGRKDGKKGRFLAGLEKDRRIAWLERNWRWDLAESQYVDADRFQAVLIQTGTLMKSRKRSPDVRRLLTFLRDEVILLRYRADQGREEAMRASHKAGVIDRLVIENGGSALCEDGEPWTANGDDPRTTPGLMKDFLDDLRGKEPHKSAQAWIRHEKRMLAEVAERADG